MTEPYTQEFRDWVLDLMELKTKAEVFAVVAAHDAEVEARALREAADDLLTKHLFSRDMSAFAATHWLRARAARIASGGE